MANYKIKYIFIDDIDADTKEEAKSLRLDIEKLKDKQRGIINGSR